MTNKSFQIVRSIIYALLTFYFINLQIFNSFSQGGAAINTTGAASAPSAMLDVSSTNQGLLIPRVILTSITSASPITNPANKLMVYNTNVSMDGGNGAGIYIYDSTDATTGKWIYLAAPSNGPGANGDVLTSSGSGAPTWTTPATYSAGTGLSLSSNTFNSVWTASGNDIYNNNTGKVGIGTSNPGNQIHVMAPSGVSEVAMFSTHDWIGGSAGSSMRFRFGASSGNTYSEINGLSAGSGAWNNLIFQSSGGNVGIGTTNPNTKLEVKNSNAEVVRTSGNTANNYLSIFNVDDGTSYYHYFQQGTAATAPITFYNPTNGSTYGIAVRNYGGSWNNVNIYNNDSYGGIQSTNALALQPTSGNVGIGTTTPTARLDIENSAASSAQGVLELNNTNGVDRNTGIDFRAVTSETYNKMAQITAIVTNGGTGGGGVIAGDLSFKTNNSNSDVPTEKMRITSDGNVGIGTTYPTAKLHIGGTAGTDGVRFPDGTLQTTASVSPSFGDGSDGDVTVAAGTTTLTKDMYYNNLVVTGTLVTDGFKIYVKETISGTGTIKWGTPNTGGNGSHATAGIGATSSGTGLFKTCAGANGGTPTANGDSKAEIHSAGVAGGTGGTGWGGGKIGGTSTATRSIPINILRFCAITGIDLTGTTFTPYTGSAGGGGGGGSNNATYDYGGGGGGAGGGLVWLSVKTWTGTFTLESKGGTGGNGAGSTCSGGGGGGGGGGVAVVIYGTKTWTGSYLLTGGAGGSVGNSSGTVGSSGAAGVSFEIQINSLL